MALKKIGAAFDEAAKWFSQPEQELFRNLHAAVLNKKEFHMFDEIEYDGIGGGVTNNNVGPKFDPPTPTRGAHHPDHNVLVVVKNSMKKVNVGLELTKMWLKYIKTNTPSIPMLAKFKDMCIETKIGAGEFDRFMNLILKLLQLEKLLVLQVCYYKDRFGDISDLHKAMRAVLACCYKEPSTLVLKTLLASKFGLSAFPTVNALYKYDHFQVLAYNCN